MGSALVIHLSDPDSPGNVLCRDRKVVDAITDHAEGYNCRLCRAVLVSANPPSVDPVPVVSIPLEEGMAEMPVVPAEVLAMATFRQEWSGTTDAMKELADFSDWLLTGAAHTAFLSCKDAAGIVESEIILLPGNPDFANASEMAEMLYGLRAQEAAYRRKHRLSNSAYLPTGSGPGVIERCGQEAKRRELLTQFAEFLLFSRLGAWVKVTNDCAAGRDDFIVERHTDKDLQDNPAPAVKERSIFDEWSWWGAEGSVFTATKDAVGPPAEITYDITLPAPRDPAADAFTFAERQQGYTRLIAGGDEVLAADAVHYLDTASKPGLRFYCGQDWFEDARYVADKTAVTCPDCRENLAALKAAYTAARERILGRPDWDYNG